VNKIKDTIATKKDFRVETYRGKGKGGQKRNKTDSCVRTTHIPSGAVGQCCEHREQGRNKKRAFERLVFSPTFQTWMKIELAKRRGLIEEINKKVDNWMREENLKVEYYTPSE